MKKAEEGDVKEEGTSFGEDVNATLDATKNQCSSCGCTFIGRDGTPTNCDIEINSRAMVAKWIPEDATTLEVGARYGTVSCAIAQKQKQSGKQVSVDADHRVWESLEKNRVSHNCNFHTVQGLLAKQDGQILENGFGTIAAPTSANLKESYGVTNGVTVPHFTVEQIQNQYGLKFDAANFDCEGCAAFLLKNFPELKTQLKLIVLEQHDEGEANATADLLSNGWVMVDHQSRQRVLANRGTEQRGLGQTIETAVTGAVSAVRELTKAVQWTFETGDCPTASMGLSCVDVCARKQLSCDQKAFKALNTEAAVREAYTSAGHSCKSMEPHQIASYWEGPVQTLDAGVCLFNAHPFGS